MSPYEKAKEYYIKDPGFRTFEEDLELHYLNGYVVSTPEIFIMARPVWSKAPEKEIIDSSVYWEIGYDCWHIWLMSGDIKKCWDYNPLNLTLVSFQRRNRLKGPHYMNNIKNRILKNHG